MATSSESAGSSRGLAARLARPAQVIIVTSVMFTFISYWRTAAVVLCDMSSTAYYIGGIVEQAIGKAAPWFILAVLLFSSVVRLVYIESCSLFVRGGVYRVVKTALGGFLGKLAVSALMFDYILTGPISSVSAGKYIVGLGLDTLAVAAPRYAVHDPAVKEAIGDWGAVLIACVITLYFFRQNLLGIQESSDKALKIMIATTIMGVIMISWCLVTLAVKGPRNDVPLVPDLGKKFEQTPDGPVPRFNPVTGEQEDPLGFLGRILPAGAAEELRRPASWLSLVGILGLFIAFGHSILAMSGEETLAQVYREVESPKLANFKKAAFIVFLYSLLLTGSISFLAVLLIPDEVRMKIYADNLIGGLAMHVLGPPEARLLLNGLVVVVGFLILSGAVNTAIIGSNGVLNRVAEDGVMPDWFLKPHPRYGTTYRVLYLIIGLQLFTIIVTHGNVYLLGEAYAFGVVWSFVFQALSMLVLRFKDPRPREYKVPLNLRVAGVEIPFGLGLIFLVLAITAVMNFFTKEVATVGGMLFTTVFMVVFTLSERHYERRRRGAPHEHREQFNRQVAAEVTPESLGLTKLYRKLVAIRSPQNLFMLERALAETDPETTGVVVMTAKVAPPGGSPTDEMNLDLYDQELMTAVVQRAERAGKPVWPLIVPTNNALHAVMQTAHDLQVHELIMGASNKYTADEQLDQAAFYWISLHGGRPAPLTIRVMSRDRDLYLDIAGGNRIPKISERRARSVAELRAAGVGVDRVLLTHDGTVAGSDLFKAVLTLLDPEVALTVVPLPPRAADPYYDPTLVKQDEERARQLGRELRVHSTDRVTGPDLVRLAQEGQYDLIILPLPQPPDDGAAPLDESTAFVLTHAPCRVFLAAAPVIPPEVIDKGPTADLAPSPTNAGDGARAGSS
ncbi:MAG TPA: APC family permease [Gemmataceae bacterium]|nr:APC family permease [Gemmataceae bacterium]